MRGFPATEAKTRLAELLRSVELGESLAITRHGNTVAHLVPAQARDWASHDTAVDRFLNGRSEWESTGMSPNEILDARHEGHRV